MDAIDLLALLRLARPLCNVSKQKPRAAIGGMLVQRLQPIFEVAKTGAIPGDGGPAVGTRRAVSFGSNH